jgi:phage terminase small subunit
MADETPQRKLTPKQEAFVLAYIGEARFNASRAAEVAGYKDPGQAGYILKKKEEIRSRIDDYLNTVALSSTEVLAELTDVATADWRDFLTIRRDKDGEILDVRMDLSAKIKSLELLGKNHKLFTDRLDVGAQESFANALREFGRGTPGA